MKIIIVGAGKVGSALTQQLSADGHNVTVVDQDPQLIDNIINIYDVMGVCGNGAVYGVQKEAEVEKAELLIATTSSDELNILSCLVARKLGAKHTIARIRNPEYEKQLRFMRDELGLSMAMTWEPTPGEPRLYRDGSGLVSAADGAVWFGLVEESVIRVFTIQTDQAAVRSSAPPPGGDDLYDHTGIETDAARAFVWDLTELLADGEREKVAELFVYPCAVHVAGGVFTVNTPEELLAYYDEAIELDVETLVDNLDYHSIFTHNGLVGAGDGTAWFGLVEDGGIRLFSLWTPQGLGVGPVS